MPVYRLTERIEFPPPEFATREGLLAVGGDLSVERLVAAYSAGIFPWPSDDTPLLWWSPDPRMVLFPNEFHMPRRLKRVRKQAGWSVTFDQAFDQVIRRCARAPRPGQDGTWITPAMVDAYCRLHREGYAHSVESWRDGALAGGLYGVSLGRCFFGESMFSAQANASKIAFVGLVERLRGWRFTLIDCQVRTEHLARFGARDIPRREFLNRLQEGIAYPTVRGNWATMGPGPAAAGD